MRLTGCCAVVVGLLAGALADCSHNNCLRAVIADAFPTRNGVADCNSYLLTTVTPAVSTFYETSTTVSTVSTSTTATDSFTTVVVVPSYTSVTQDTTETGYTTETDYTTIVVSTTIRDTTVAESDTTTFDTVTTETSLTVTTVATVVTTSNDATTTITSTVVPNAARRAAAVKMMEPRQITVTPTDIPAYASSCPSPAAYVSACLCAGATVRTITAAAPSTTITSTSVTFATSTSVSTTDATLTDVSTTTVTVSTTSTISTEDVSTTVSTRYSTGTASTLVTVSTTGTVVESTTAVETATSAATLTSVTLGTSTTITTTTSTAPARSCQSPAFANSGFESSSTSPSPWVYSAFSSTIDGGVATSSDGDFTAFSGNNYLCHGGAFCLSEVTNTGSLPIEARIAQSPYLCDGESYTISLRAAAICRLGNGALGSCAGSSDATLQVATAYGFSTLWVVTSAGPDDWQEFQYTFTWSQPDGLSPMMVDLFLEDGGEKIAVDGISIDFAS